MINLASINIPTKFSNNRRMKMAIIGLQRGLKMVKSQGNVSEKSGNFEMDIQWQQCLWSVSFYNNFDHDDLKRG